MVFFLCMVCNVSMTVLTFNKITLEFCLIVRCFKVLRKYKNKIKVEIDQLFFLRPHKL